MSDSSVWLGVPLKEKDGDVADAYVSKIGGKAVLLRACAEGEKHHCPAAFKCPKCKSADHVSLLAQLYAPLECYDRVLYILTCASCGVLPGPKTEGTALATATPLHGTTGARAAAGGKRPHGVGALAKTSFCFAVRSQNFNQAYYRQLVEERKRQADAAAKARDAAVAVKGNGALLFKETDDWGGADDWGSEPGEGEEEIPEEEPAEHATAEAASDAESAPLPTLQQAFALAPKGTIVALRGRAYTGGLPLDLFVEPPQRQERLGSTEEQLQEAQRKYGVEAGTLDTTSFEEDEETPAEMAAREYMERIELSPSQCVRWCPGGDPLRAGLLPALQPIPPCPRCQAPRRFECQLTAPTVYYLTKNMGESNNANVHFGNVFVFTCSANCYADDGEGYLREHVVVEDEF